MADSPADFIASLTSNIQNLKAEVNRKVYNISIELFLRIVERTPSPSNKGHQARGLLANQWYVSSGNNFSSSLGSSISNTGSDSVSRINAMRGGRVFDGKNGTVTLANNVPYAYRAEMLGWPAPDWTGTVGPYRMVALSLQEIGAKHR